MAAIVKMSASRAYDFGFPPPRGGAQVRDADGLLWTWIDEHSGLSGLGDLGAWTTAVGQGSGLASAGLGIAAALAHGTAFGAIAGPIGAILGLVGGVIAGIFGQHAARVAQENKVSGQWAAGGPQAISSIVTGWQSGSVSGSDAKTALDQLYASFLQQNQSITKYNGNFGRYPDPTQSRPSSNCNWACGTSYDLYQEIQGLKGQIDQGDPTGLGTSVSGLLSNPLPLIAIGAAALLLLRK